MCDCPKGSLTHPKKGLSEVGVPTRLRWEVQRPRVLWPTWSQRGHSAWLLHAEAGKPQATLLPHRAEAAPWFPGLPGAWLRSRLCGCVRNLGSMWSGRPCGPAASYLYDTGDEGN